MLVAVLAFELVISLDLTRRENNTKVRAVQVQMQQMMCTLFQYVPLTPIPIFTVDSKTSRLRLVKDPDEVGLDGIIIKDRLQPLVRNIARDIKDCGSACDVYLRKNFISSCSFHFFKS